MIIDGGESVSPGNDGDLLGASGVGARDAQEIRAEKRMKRRALIELRDPVGPPGPAWVFADDVREMVERMSVAFARRRNLESRGLDQGDLSGTVLKYLCGDYEDTDPADKVRVKKHLRRGKPLWEGWDPEGDVPWTRHVSGRVWGALLNAWQRYGVNTEGDSGGLGVDLRRVRIAQKRWKEEHGINSEPTYEDLAASLRLSVKRVRELHTLLDLESPMALIESEFNEIPIDEKEVDAEATREEWRTSVWRAFDELPDEERELAERRWVFDESALVIAQDLGIDKATVNRRLAVIRDQLAAAWDTSVSSS